MATSSAKPKRAKRISPTQLTLQRLRKLGGTAAVVEKWNAHAKVRQDLFGGIDVVCLIPGQAGVLGVQATSENGGNLAKRMAKLEELDAMRLWLSCGNRLECWGWRQKGARWKLRRMRAVLDDDATVLWRKVDEDEAASYQSEPELPLFA